MKDGYGASRKQIMTLARKRLRAWEPEMGEDWTAKKSNKVTKIEKDEKSRYFK